MLNRPQQPSRSRGNSARWHQMRAQEEREGIAKEMIVLRDGESPVRKDENRIKSPIVDQVIKTLVEREQQDVPSANASVPHHRIPETLSAQAPISLLSSAHQVVRPAPPRGDRNHRGRGFVPRGPGLSSCGRRGPGRSFRGAA